MGELRRQLVLIVDDDPGMRRALGRLLGAAGYATCSSGSAEEITLNEIGRADCLVIDERLPGAFGSVWYAAISAPRPPAVFVTAFDSEGLRAATRELGSNRVLAKPFDGRELIEAVHAAIRRT